MHLGGFTEPVEPKAQGDLQQQEPAVEPAVEGVALQVAGVAVEFLQGRDVVQHPFAVGPPQATASVVVIRGLIRKTVVMAVQTHPFDRAALAGQGAHQHQDALNPHRHHQAAVRHQTVQAQGDAQDRHPIENAKGHNALPAPEARQQRHGGEHVHHQHEAGGSHLEFALTRGQSVTRCHHRGPLPKLAGVSCLRGNQADSPWIDKAAQTGKPGSGWCR